MGALSLLHWLVLILVVLIVFGTSRIAGLGKGLGEGIRSFKRGLTGDAPDETESNGRKQIPPSKDAP
jgi:sec-independent protein translocase protein TatA